MATVAAVDSSNLQASGFFGLRTPLLPVDELRAWSGGLYAAEPAAQTAMLEAALAAHRPLLTERLGAADVQEAMFLASPELYAALVRTEPIAKGIEADARRCAVSSRTSRRWPRRPHPSACSPAAAPACQTPAHSWTWPRERTIKRSNYVNLAHDYFIGLANAPSNREPARHPVGAQVLWLAAPQFLCRGG